MSGIRLWPVLAVGFLAGCSGADSNGLIVSAASDLQEVAGPLAERFTTETGRSVQFNFGASGMLTQQIEAGAKPDVFASANVGFVERLQRGGFALDGTATAYAKGRLVVLTSKGRRPLQALDELRHPAFAKIAVANPETAPYGAAAKDAIAAARLAEALQAKLIIAENVRQAFQYVEVGEVDAAFVSASLAVGLGGRVFEVSEALHRPLVQAAVVLKASSRPQDARRFVEFLAGENGRRILTNHGFEPPPTDPSKP